MIPERVQLPIGHCQVSEAQLFVGHHPPFLWYANFRPILAIIQPLPCFTHQKKKTEEPYFCLSFLDNLTYPVHYLMDNNCSFCCIIVGRAVTPISAAAVLARNVPTPCPRRERAWFMRVHPSVMILQNRAKKQKTHVRRVSIIDDVTMMLF